jgi:outer membrane immunogenic protein
MKTAIFATAMLGASVFALQSASAADLAARPYTKAPPLASPVYDWSGFYVGAHVGYAWGDEHDNLSVVMGALADQYNVSGVIGGGHVGYNWQFQQTVFGLEADLDGSGVRGSRAYDNFSNTRVYEMRGDLSMQNNWQSSIRARLGIAQNDWLFYVTGGVAIADVDSTLNVARTNVTACEGICVFTNVRSSDSHVLTGWTAGGGIEHAFAPHWTGRVDVRYTDFGAQTFNFVANGNLPVPTRVHFDQVSSTIGVSYKF